MTPPRTLMDMHQLEAHWQFLGSKMLTRKEQPTDDRGFKTKKLTPEAMILHTQTEISVKLKNEDDATSDLYMRVLAPTPAPQPDVGATEEPANVLSQSKPQPNPENALGRVMVTGALAVRAAICAQHVSERDLIPKAQYNEWPVEIGFERTLVADLCVEGGMRQTNLFWNAVDKSTLNEVGMGSSQVASRDSAELETAGTIFLARFLDNNYFNLHADASFAFG
ncbi:hypothetical protein B0H16DRAFT_1446386 [Mycena metata]|uniref:Uncharacterized protein n=1 Tax=Mycena metata TaxID=1033252 RepID=A0AAD7KIW8_9AGAR|nr:hypothetical protein B0H16DRAFT_1446386 [Mycena metata]